MGCEELCEDEGCPHHGTPHVCNPTRLADPAQPDRAFEAAPTRAAAALRQWGPDANFGF